MRVLVSGLFLVGLLMSSASFSAEAEQVQVIPKPLNVMPSKIKPVQSNADELSRAAPESESGNEGDKSALEILSPRPSYGFQNNFWMGQTRKDIAAFLKGSSGVSSSRLVRNLALRVTLTPSATLPESKTPDDNIYALRLNKLVNLGSFDDAQTLYKLNESSPPTSLAAQAGIESSLGHGEIAVACLDQKTFGDGLKENTPTFWTNIDIFCQALLSPIAGDDDALRLAHASRAYIAVTKPTASSTNDINQLDAITTIALMETGKLSDFLKTSAQIRMLDDKHLALLAGYAKPSPTNIPLLAESITRGIVSNSKAIDFLKAIDLTDTSNPYAAFLKEYFKSAEAPLVTDQLLALATDSIKEALLYPIYSASEMAIPNNYKHLSLRLLALTDQELPANLVTEAYGNVGESAADESADKKAKSGEETLIKLLLEKAKTEGKLAPDNASSTLLALDYANYPQKETKNAYDNLLSLTPIGNYVMPIGDILSSLKKSADKKQINQVVIRSLAIIDDKPLEQLHPAVLYRILEALNSAGLNEETMALTREVLGYQIRN